MKSIFLSVILSISSSLALAASFDLPSQLNQCKQVSGKTMTQLKAQPVVLTIAATWCDVCKSLLPKNETLAEQYSGQVQFVNIMTAQSVLSDAQAEAQSNSHISFYFNDPDTITAPLNIDSVPYSYVLDKDGNVVFSGFALDDFTTYQNAVDSVSPTHMSH